MFLQFHSTADAALNILFTQICIQAEIKISCCAPHTACVITVVVCAEFFVFLDNSSCFFLGDVLSPCYSFDPTFQWRGEEYFQAVCGISENVICTAAYDDATAFFRKITYDLTFCFKILSFGASSCISVFRYI